MAARVVVTGGAGFIGSHIAEALIERRYEVAVLDNLSTGNRSNVPNGATFYEADITDASEVRRVWSEVRPVEVFHLAAQMDVRVSTRDPHFDATTNILGSLSIILSSMEMGTKRIVYASSGGAAYGQGVKLPATEDIPPEPLSPYGITKHTVEHYLAMYRCWGGPSFAALRLPNVYGPRQSPLGEAGVVAIFLGRALRGEDLIVYGDGEQTRDYVFVSDIVNAFLRAAGQPEVSGVFNVGTGRETSVNKIIKVIGDVAGVTPVVKHAPQRIGEVRRISLSADRATAAFGWVPGVSLEDGVKITLAWLQTVNA